MNDTLDWDLYSGLEELVLIDPHSHINPHAAASKNLADLLGYHYYTELAHSAGLPKHLIEDPSIGPKEKVGRLVEKLADLNNTIQVSWLIEMCQEFFDFHEKQITPDNWEALYDNAELKLSQPDWEESVLRESGLEKVFLTNDFDDPLMGFDTSRYVPCLRTDDLVFHFTKPEVRERLAKASGVDFTDLVSLRSAIGQRFDHFTRNNAKACAISLPPTFSPEQVDAGVAAGIVARVLKGDELCGDDQKTLGQWVFWTLTEFCAEHGLPFDLMIGVNRRVYAEGVFQGQDLFDTRVSLIQYKSVFNAFPQVTFPISVLTHMSNQELVSYSWIFPNVVTNGHWWYSNIPAYIETDTRARLEAVPRSKQIGYYSDMYKLEFGLPKFRMYKRTLARVLAEEYVRRRQWSEVQAIDLGHQILRGNVERIFKV
ncbi:glucuronate isomerase [Planctomicrobium sp. SH668]|uniref:glucuronate isomerase n=1 Tax=Planctomicrobium sp. SH668 TaxID=3448126 RepID=UPI003F5B7F27